MNPKLKARLRKQAPPLVFWWSVIMMTYGSLAFAAFEARNPLARSYDCVRHLLKALTFQRGA